MSRQDFKDVKKAFKQAARELEDSLDDFRNCHDLSKAASAIANLRPRREEEEPC